MSRLIKINLGLGLLLIFIFLLVAKPKNNSNSDVRVLFVGDIMLDRLVSIKSKKESDPCYPFKKIQPFLNSFDAVIGNNEGSITNFPSLAEKSGYPFARKGSTDYLKFTFNPQIVGCYSKNNIKIVSIGNNHIMDFGEKGTKETTKLLKAGGIKYFGNPYITDENILIEKIQGKKIALIGHNLAGGATTDKVIDQIKNARQKADIVVMYPHWALDNKTDLGNEQQVDLAHKFIDSGADAVIGTHPHVPQNTEIYKGKYIFYSLASFVFDFKINGRSGMGIIMKINGKTNELTFEQVQFDLTDDYQVFVKQNSN